MIIMVFGESWAPARCQIQGAKECRLRRTNSTAQGEAIAGNTVDDALMVDQGSPTRFVFLTNEMMES